MKGLIMKDIMCLRKQRVTFCFVVIVTLVLSVMYVLSCRFGNLQASNLKMIAENEMTEIDVKNLSTMALTFFMMLTLAMVGDISATFNMDLDADFAKLQTILPLPLWKRVLSKYATVYVMVGIGAVVDIIIAAILSFLTDIIIFGELFGIIISIGSFMIIEGCLGILYCYLLGKGKSSMAMFLAGLTMITGIILFNLESLKTMLASPGEGDITPIIDYLKYRYYVLFAIAIVVSALSYLGLYRLADRKRGII